MTLRDVQAQGRILRAIASRGPEVVVIDHAVGHDHTVVSLRYGVLGYFQQVGRAYRPVRLSATAPEVRGDVRDAVLDAYMIQRVEAMGASQLDIDDAFGGSRLGFSEPVII